MQKAVLNTRITRSIELPYLCYLPRDYAEDPDRAWPLILFLHGAGERGEDLDRVRRVGLPPVIEAWPESPFIVVAPQCPAGMFSPEDFSRLRGLPAQLFHGTADNIIPVTETEYIHAHMRAAGVDVRATYYEGVGHDSWTAVYGTRALFAWLLEKARG